MSDLEDMMEAIRQRRGSLSTLGYRVRIALHGEGSILIDATEPDVLVSEGDEETQADTVIRMSPGSMHKLLAGKLNAMWAYTIGELKVEGSQGVALKLGSLLGKA